MPQPSDNDRAAEAYRITEQRIAKAVRNNEIWLDLRRMSLTSLPPDIGSLTALATLYLNSNKLTALPPEFTSLTALKGLVLINNQLTALPPEITSLKALTTLYLDYNQLTALPPEIESLKALTVLDVSGNQLATLPPEFRSLTALSALFLHENAALGIPDSVLGPKFEEVQFGGKTAARPQDILNFYFGRMQAEAAGTARPILEIKLMLVGRGGAGKTSLRRFFLGQPHDADEKETLGIALDTFPLVCQQGEVTVRLWDFGGQEITHALHQFFLTEGCIYLLVLDPRSNTEMQDAEYWLGLLQRYAGNSPILLVLNRQDARQGGYEVDRLMLKERFPLIQSFTRTNCAAVPREGCDDLLLRLREAVDSLPPTEPPHLQVPEPWLKVMLDCDSTAFGRQHMTLDEFRQICASHGEGERGKQESLARLLHKLGVVLHFVEDPRLRDTSVLNPHWVTDGVYRLLRLKDGPESDGVLSLTEALEALPGEYERDARFLLRLMERFEMCCPLEGKADAKLPTKWLIPGALAEFQPAGVTDDWQQPDIVRLRYVYDPLPEGVLPRFIVRTHLLSDGQSRWRNGVILTDGEARALVRRGANRNHVEVTAFGPDTDRLRLLQIIQGNMERINADLPKPKPYAELELAHALGVFCRVDDLKAAELGNLRLPVGTGRESLLVEPTSQLNLTSEPASRDDEHVPLHAFLSYSHDDKRAKGIFQNNLTVMQQKNLITPWHDGLIEPGMLWKEEIKEDLSRMDVFVGLLTTAFLASNFIHDVELDAAINKRQEDERDFLFVLILVDDISLTGLDLAAYQIMKPGGKAVSKHHSHKKGFNQAQTELEKLIRNRQPKMRARRSKEHGETNDFPIDL